MQTASPPVHTYAVYDVTEQPAPAVKVDEYQAVACVVSDVWTGSFIFCQPPPSETTVTFGQPGSCPALTQYAGIDWGQAQWSCLTFAWFGLPANNISFSQAVDSRSFSFQVPHILVGMTVSTAQTGTLTLASDTGEMFATQVLKGQPLTVKTGWLKPAKTITVTFSGKWLLSLGSIVYQ